LVLGWDVFNVHWGVVGDEMEGIVVALGKLGVGVGWDGILK